ncbi:MAG: TIGR04282 family arsenosugar biosynthesis glycosyltransferase [Thiohalocapsa sp.]
MSLTARILLFAKAPVPGRAKTRLIPALGADGAAQLHEQLLRATVAKLSGPSLPPIELWCAPDGSHQVFRDLARQYKLELHDQSCGDLGARLLAAAVDALRRADCVLMIGGDCPELGCTEVAMAHDALRRPGVDALLGPAADGGYVMLGLRRAEASLFASMPWGGDRVAAITRKRMAALGWCWEELPALRDVDRPDDLAWYRENFEGK